MSHKKWIGIALLATVAATSAGLSTSAVAGDRGINTALGAVVGAVIGGSVGGQDAAIIGGVLGAVVGASAGGDGRHDSRYDNRYNNRYDSRQGGRYQSQAYYQAQPAYYQVQPTYYRPVPVNARRDYRDGYSGRNDYQDRSYNDGRRVDYGRGEGENYYRR